jgi:hypothetical protein
MTSPTPAEKTKMGMFAAFKSFINCNVPSLNVSTNN